jgi:hypothetical protein
MLNRHAASIRPWCLVLALPVLSFPAVIGAAQNPPISYWRLRSEQENAMLLQVPDGDDHRYQLVREYFSDLHCTPELMEEQTARKHNRKNLLCVLPGKGTELILVAARYERRRGRIGEGWSEAVMLPLLYNALQAQPRQHTFVFAALSGTAGENEFIDSIQKRYGAAVKAIVVLDSLGLSEPRFYTAPSTGLTAAGRERKATSKVLESEAAFTTNFQRIPGSKWLSSLAAENTLLFQANRIPAILIYSDFRTSVSASAFQQEFDFLAYYLCRIDAALASPLPSSNR